MERLNIMYNKIELGAKQYDPHSRGVVLCRGMPIICKVKEFKITKNWTLVILKCLLSI